MSRLNRIITWWHYLWEPVGAIQHSYWKLHNCGGLENVCYDHGNQDSHIHSTPFDARGLFYCMNAGAGTINVKRCLSVTHLMMQIKVVFFFQKQNKTYIPCLIQHDIFITRHEIARERNLDYLTEACPSISMFQTMTNTGITTFTPPVIIHLSAAFIASNSDDEPL